MKYFIQSDSYDFYRSGGLNSSIASQGYADFQCSEIGGEDEAFCSEMWDRLHINRVIVTEYELTNVKAKLEDNPADFNDSFLSYIEYLPNYVTASLNDAKFRVLVEFKRSLIVGVVWKIIILMELWK